MLYLIGSLRNQEIPNIANQLRQAGHEVFDDWFAAGPEADDYWRDYERSRGHSFTQALQGLAARNVYAFDKRNLQRADAAILALPAGKSGHLEMGWMLGQGKRGYILLDANDPERFDVMYQFATGVFNTLEELIDELKSSADQLDQIGRAACWIHSAPFEPAFGCDCPVCQRVSRHR